MTAVFVSTVLPAPVAEVWRIVRDFNALPNWVPFARSSRIEDGQPPDRVGCVRIVLLADGATVRERLVALSDYDMSFSYTLLDGPPEVAEHLATLALAPVTDRGHTFASWEAEFSCRPDREAAVADHLARATFGAGFEGLHHRLSGR
jgi:hypothetical protein